MTTTHFHFDTPVNMPNVRPRRSGSDPAAQRPAFQSAIVAAMARHLLQGTWITEGPRAIAEEIRQITDSVRVVLAVEDQAVTAAPVICGVSGMDSKAWSHEFTAAAAAAIREIGTEESPALQRFAELNRASRAFAFRFPALDSHFTLLVIGAEPEFDWKEQLTLEQPWLINILSFWLAAERGCHQPRKKSWFRRLHIARWPAIGVAALALAALIAIPRPYHVAAKVTVEPEVRSILSAPFAGRLERTLVEPGDVVQPGQTLAKLDPRDLQIELASAEAEERETAARHQGALAGRQGNSSLVTKLELEQIQFKVQTLRHRLEQLDIKSSLAGVVTRGDLKRLEGAPLTAGQTLLEVAPLENLIAEVAIPEAEIEQVRPEMPVEIRLDAFPYQSWQGTVKRIHPRAELLQNQSVYIAEVQLTGDTSAWRPGMNGRASITADVHPLGWNLFHRPLAALLQMVGW